MTESPLKEDGVFKWYVPGTVENESDHIAGTLDIATNGIATLSLVGLLPGSDSGANALGLGDIATERCIFGVLKDSRYVMLRNLGNGGLTLNNALSHQKFQARECVVFNSLTDVPELDSVTCMQVALDALEDWVSEPMVTLKKTKHGPMACASKSTSGEFKLEDKTVFLKTNIRFNAPTDIPVKSVTIKQESYYEVVPNIPRRLESIRDEFHLLEDLLLLLADVETALPWPTVRYGGQAGIYYFDRRRSDTQKVEVLKSWAALRWLGATFGTLLSQLEAQQNKLGPGLYLYLGIRRSPALYLENKFSMAIFGLESLHRRVGAQAAPQSALEEKVKRIISDVKIEKDRKWLEGRLKNAGEPNLEERLYQTFSELEIGLEPKALRGFSKECADLRNQVAHFGGQRDGGYDTFIQRMHTLNEAVRPLYHAVLLNRIGMGKDRIWAYFHRSPYSPQRKKIMVAAGLAFVPPPMPVGSDAQSDQAPT